MGSVDIPLGEMKFHGPIGVNGLYYHKP
ncbi:uncharacterized protein G2W53_040447 [Senna tora]|uniref:Uncharacterized protein n=1 Tax=Senna tora TaxID=362788 RepID=A0A834W0G9_9FABA|nr:uncharacterized protein G2W53_040447 [Senna tora]